MFSLAPNVTFAQLSYFVAVAEELHFGRCQAPAHRPTTAQPGHPQPGGQPRRGAVRALQPARRAHRRRRAAAARGARGTGRRRSRGQDRPRRRRRSRWGGPGRLSRLWRLRRHRSGGRRVRRRWRRAAAADPSGRLHRPQPGLADAHVDAAFVRLPISTSGLELEPLSSEPRVVVLPSSHPLAARESITVAELLSERWLQMPATDRAWRDFWLAREHRQGAEPLLGPEVRTVDEQPAATTAGGYVSLTAASVAAFYPRSGISYVPGQGIEPSRVAIAWRRGDHRQTLHSFIATVRAVAASLPHADAALTAARKAHAP